jgi:hypothetical protein
VGQTEKIDINGTQFRIFNRLPYRVGAEFQRKILEAYKGLDIPLSKIRDLDLDDVTAKQMSEVDLKKVQEAHEHLLKNAVISPKITDEILDDYQHELQDCIEPLIEKLMSYYGEKGSQKKTISQ